MGLDISYYTLGDKIKYDEDVEIYSEEFYEKYGYDVIYLHDDWEQSDDMEGLYDSTRIDGFRAGSYSGYSLFRRMLHKISVVCAENHPELMDLYGPTPFMDLINFTDSDGFIGPFTSGRLSDVFNAYQKIINWEVIKPNKYGYNQIEEIDFTRDELDYFYSVYRSFQTAFEKVKGKGIVLFH